MTKKSIESLDHPAPPKIKQKKVWWKKFQNPPIFSKFDFFEIFDFFYRPWNRIIYLKMHHIRFDTVVAKEYHIRFDTLVTAKNSAQDELSTANLVQPNPKFRVKYPNEKIPST